MMRIEASNIVVRFGDRDVLRDVSIAIDRGELIGLIGPNGSGKTTLLRVLADLLAPNSGAVCCSSIEGVVRDKSELSRSVAYLPQGAEVHWPMRVETLVALGRLPHRRQFRGLSQDDRRAIADALAATDTLMLRERTMSQISGGERMRVLLARALAVEAPILLADEPVAALDPLHQLQVMDLLRARVACGAGVIVVLHDLSLAARYCSRLVLLSQGTILADGAPEQVLSDGNLAQAFGIKAVRGAHAGVPFIVPWMPVGQQGETP